MKHCPVCPNTELSHGYLETGLPAYECQLCGGLWISAIEYLVWSRSQPVAPWDESPPDRSLLVEDSQAAILCPDCGRILRRYQVWPDFDFNLDRCGGCHGVWFDQNEWQLLKLHGMHHKVNQFFTEPWQRKLREEETRRRFERMYTDKFGSDDYAEVQRIKGWLTSHSQGSGLIAYLTDENPYRG